MSVQPRRTLAQVKAYVPERPGCAIDLSDNTNLFGVPPAAAESLRDVTAAAITRYPVAYVPALRQAAARYFGVEPERIATGCGSDDVIDCAIRAFVEPGEKVAHSDPTFSMVPVFARLNGCEPVAVPLRDDLDVDADALLATKAKLIYLCSPNNPTGTTVSRASLEKVLNGATGVVLLDEAYAEFARENFLARALERDNVLVTRTMSKAFGLAGLRVGFGLGAPALVVEVEKSRGPYKITSIAERAATAALTRDLDWVRTNATEAREVRERLVDGLRRQGLAPLPSEANFVMVPVPGAAEVSERMREQGVQVRAFTGLTKIGDALRIGCGPWTMLERCLAALEEART